MNQPIDAELRDDIDTIEDAYEFMLAYAAQGLAGNEAGGAGAQIRDTLSRCYEAVEGLPARLQAVVEAKNVEPMEPYHAFIDIVERDASYTQTALRLLLLQPAISSQLVDNLNAWIHLRALLTDLFVIDEILKGT
jgi:hypothetical protein